METIAPPAEFSRMTKIQKLAALFIILGADCAAQVMRQLTEPELEAVCGEMAKLQFIPQELQKQILHEFTAVAVEATAAVLGGASFAQLALEKSVGLFRASDIINRVSPSRAHLTAMQSIVEMEPRQISNLIKDEQPQTIALVLSYLPPKKSSQVLVLLRSDLREQVVERLATMSPTPIEVVEKVVDILNHKLGGKQVRALQHTGGLKTAADLLNCLDKSVSKSLLIALEEHNPDLGQAVRQKMFSFEDLVTLESPALQKILRETDMSDLVIALKTASERLKSILLACISKRAAQTVLEEISYLGPLKLRDIEAAQNRVIETVRRLESEGEIELGAAAETQPNEALV